LLDLSVNCLNAGGRGTRAPEKNAMIAMIAMMEVGKYHIRRICARQGDL
jgi:hypothetical protein